MTVKLVADQLHVTEETVRRWLRSGKLHGTMSNNKEGYDISDEDLDIFVKQSKYIREVPDDYVTDALNCAITKLENKKKAIEEDINRLKKILADVRKGF